MLNVCNFYTADGNMFPKAIDSSIDSHAIPVIYEGKSYGTRMYIRDKYRDGEFREVPKEPIVIKPQDLIATLSNMLDKANVPTDLHITVDNQNVVDLMGKSLLGKDYPIGSKHLQINCGNSHGATVTTFSKVVTKGKAKTGSLKELIEEKLKELTFTR